MITHELLLLFRGGWDDAIAMWSALARPATPAQNAKAVVARRAAVLKTTGRRVGEQVVVTLTVPNVSTGSGTIQCSEVVTSVLEARELKVACGTHKAVFCVFPPAEEELKAEQLTEVQKCLEGEIGPYVDFKLKLQGTTFSSDGRLIPIEVASLPNIDC